MSEELKEPYNWNGYYPVLCPLHLGKLSLQGKLYRLYCVRFSLYVYFYVPKSIHERLVKTKGDYWGTGDYSVWIETQVMDWAEQYCYDSGIFAWFVYTEQLDQEELDDVDGKRHDNEGNLTFGDSGTGHTLVEDEDELKMVATLTPYEMQYF